MDSLVKRIKPRGHFMENRRNEILLGLFLALAGCCLLWDAFDGRGKRVPWPASALAPW